MQASVVAAGTGIHAARRAGVGTRIDVAILVASIVLFAALKWCVVNSFWGDSPRWIFEAYRCSSGELPYKDFAWQYAPLPIFLFGAAMRLFGQAFETVQVVLDVIGAGIVLLTWDVARRIFPRPLPLLIAAALACAGTSNTSNFALFSLEIYTPAMLVGMVGMLLALREVVDYIKQGEWNVRGKMWASIGATIGLLSKPEFMAAIVGCFLALALSDLKLHFRGRPLAEWIAHYVKLSAIIAGPAVVLYVVTGFVCGFDNMMAGIGGYGLAKLMCPWWPTGLGLFGGVVAIGYAVILAAVLSLSRLSAFRKRFGSRYLWLWVLAGLSVVATAFYIPYCVTAIPVFQGKITLFRTVAYFLSTGTILLPVMWISILVCVLLSVRLYRAIRKGTAWTERDSLILTMVTGAVLISLRSLFNGTMSELSLASSAAYPIFFLVGPYLAIRFLTKPLEKEQPLEKTPQARAVIEMVPAAVVILIAGFMALRFVNTIVTEASQSYTRVSTNAGSVRLKDHTVGPQARDYVMAHTVPGDFLLDLAFGGGLNFSERLQSPIFSTQFTALTPAPRYLALDLALIQTHPPRLVIANEGENFQSAYGVCMNTGCTFPNLVWRSTRLACDESFRFPVLDYIRNNYVRQAQFGDKVIYARK